VSATSIFDSPTGPFVAFGQPPVVGIPERRPRVRMIPELDPKLRVWLTRCSRVHAALSNVVRVYSNPERAGGMSNAGDEYVARAQRGCPTLLWDCLAYCHDELQAIQAEVGDEMEDTPATRHPPGSKAKVAILAQRFHDGKSLFIEADSRTDVA
jgi:hypothetical protein